MSQPTFSWTCTLAFIEIKWLSLPSSVCLCFRNYSSKQIKFSKFVEYDVRCNIFELRSTLAKPAVVVLTSSQTAQRTLKTSKSASMVSPSFFMFQTKPSSERKIFSCQVGLGLWRLQRLSWAQHLAAEDGHNDVAKCKPGNLEKIRCSNFPSRSSESAKNEV